MDTSNFNRCLYFWDGQAHFSIKLGTWLSLPPTSTTKMKRLTIIHQNSKLGKMDFFYSLTHCLGVLMHTWASLAYLSNQVIKGRAKPQRCWTYCCCGQTTRFKNHIKRTSTCCPSEKFQKKKIFLHLHFLGVVLQEYRSNRILEWMQERVHVCTYIQVDSLTHKYPPMIHLLGHLEIWWGLHMFERIVSLITYPTINLIDCLS